MMKQQRLFTGMYLIGTAVSIALAMTLFIIFYIKLGPVYPEYNRGNMLVIKDVTKKVKFVENRYLNVVLSVSSKLASLLKKESDAIEHIALAFYCKMVVSHGENAVEEYGHTVNNEFWEVFNYRFIDGRPFTADEQHEKVVIISRAFAEKFFADTQVAGKMLNVGRTPHRVIGVVEQASGCSSISATGGNYWLPIVPAPDEEDIQGKYHAYITTNNTDKAQSDIEECFNRLAQTKEEKHTMELERFWQQALDCDKEDTLFDAMAKYFYILLAFLFIPALNLSGMISSRMDRRMDEIGIRKAYGATVSRIVSQVLWENLLLSLIGAIFGVALSYVVVCTCDSWITTLFDTEINNQLSRTININMLFNPAVLCIAILITVLLNVASALVPTLIALRRNIVEALYHKR